MTVARHVSASVAIGTTGALLACGGGDSNESKGVDPADVSAEELVWMVNCSSSVTPEIKNFGDNPVTLYSGISEGTDILFPAESGTLDGANDSGTNMRYTLADGRYIVLNAGPGVLSEVASAERGDVIGIMNSELLELEFQAPSVRDDLEGVQFTMSLYQTLGEETAEAEYAGCLE
jgi:hypothetical protein